MGINSHSSFVLCLGRVILGNLPRTWYTVSRICTFDNIVQMCHYRAYSIPCRKAPTMTLLPPPTSGIYQIRCIPTGKIYVGSAVNLRKRQRDHINSLRRGNHENTYLQRAWNKYGEANFDFTILEFVDASDLLYTEQVWID